jgi:hypothetical protein
VSGKLPPLPEPDGVIPWTLTDESGQRETVTVTAYLPSRLLAYARAVQDAERERCAQIAERHFIPGHSVAGPAWAAQLAAQIRGQT